MTIARKISEKISEAREKAFDAAFDCPAIPDSVVRFFYSNKSPARFYRAHIEPPIERARNGWSRWDAAALGIDKSLLPATGDAMAYLASKERGWPAVDPYQEADDWTTDLYKHARALQSLRVDLAFEEVDFDTYTAMENARYESVKEAMAWVGVWHGYLWD